MREFAMVNPPPFRAAAVAPSPGSPEDVVAQLPELGSGERWPWLQRLRGQRDLLLDPWLRAVETGRLTPQADLLAVLAPHLDGSAMARLLRWWLVSAPRDPALPAQLVPHRDPEALAALRQACAASLNDGEALVALLPLLGHQRDPADFPLLRRLAVEPGPLRLRQAALEGLCRGLAAWPLSPLRATLSRLAGDLHPPVAAAAVDALARLPWARPALRALGRQALEPTVADRLARRLRRLPPAPLLLLAHGRAGGAVPPELEALAEELRQRRGSPVRLETLTAATPSPPQAPSLEPTTLLVPLFLLPGTHVRKDVPARCRHGRQDGPMRMLPFLGAWPAWQEGLADELRRLAGRAEGATPLLVHHPVDGPLPQRYLAHLATSCGARCLAFPPPAAPLEEPPPLHQEAALPLALAASRLTDAHPAWLGSPLLARPRLRELLLQLLEDLP
ncbi:MAG: CbiX/SirB N-terminal domain-containing protein [Cyanobacteriota bacterium]|nr:CbiX/SirB N-terminal domain-containing protein [Cyanobacteriota bacterium]